VRSSSGKNACRRSSSAMPTVAVALPKTCWPGSPAPPRASSRKPKWRSVESWCGLWSRCLSRSSRRSSA
jgi:hypothetical protein